VTVDVIIPTTRQSVDVAIRSLEQQSVDRIITVSNEITPSSHTLVRFDSKTVPYGRGDAGLRRDIGADVSQADILVFMDDDCIAPRGMIRDVVAFVKRDGFCWGHHRFVDTTRFSPERLMEMPPELGRPREKFVNDWHGWHSSYAGLLGIQRELFWNVGGFDLAFLGYHGNEDQHLGRRLSNGTNKTFVHEPPFAWHPESTEAGATKSNFCERDHSPELLIQGDDGFLRCMGCPFRRPVDPVIFVMVDGVTLPYDRNDIDLEVLEM
jgi:hypothetical protein